MLVVAMVSQAAAMVAQAAVMVAQVAVTALATVELRPSLSRQLTRLKLPRMPSMLLQTRLLNKPDPN